MVKINTILTKHTKEEIQKYSKNKEKKEKNRLIRIKVKTSYPHNP